MKILLIVIIVALLIYLGILLAKMQRRVWELEMLSSHYEKMCEQMMEENDRIVEHIEKSIRLIDELDKESEK